MRTFVAAAMVAAMATTSAFAAADTSFAPGKPAGVQQAQRMSDNTVWWLVGLGVVAAGIALVASGSNNNSLVTGTVGSTSTTSGTTGASTGTTTATSSQ